MASAATSRPPGRLRDPGGDPYLSIQSLRALAAVSVAIYHAFQWRDGGFEAGRAGVDVFFVISGFIMWTITAGRPARPGAFLWRRFTRVAPTYWLITLGLAGMALAWPMFLPQVSAGWRHVLLSMAFIPHLDRLGVPFPVLPPGWTLNYEAVFYLLFTLGLFLREQARIVLVTLALFGVGILGMLIPPTYQMGANFMMAEFAGGLWLGKLAHDGVLPGRLAGGLLLGAALAIFAVTNQTDFGDSLLRPLLWGVPAVVLVCGAVTLETAGHWPRWRWLKAVGDASYSIYLCHVPATALVAHAMGAAPLALFIPAAIAASVGAGMLCRAFVERPLLALLRGGARTVVAV